MRLTTVLIAVPVVALSLLAWPVAPIVLAVALAAWLLTAGSGVFAGPFGGLAVFVVAAPAGILLGASVFVVAIVGLAVVWVPELLRRVALRRARA